MLLQHRQAFADVHTLTRLLCNGQAERPATPNAMNIEASQRPSPHFLDFVVFDLQRCCSTLLALRGILLL